MKHRLLSFAAALSLSCSAVHAAEDVAPLTIEYGRCVEQSGSSDVALLRCLGAEYTRQDKRLNDAYRRLLARVSRTKAGELRRVQRAWLAYVQLGCGFLYDNEEFAGTLHRLDASSCNVRERARRAADLEGLLQRLGEK